MSREITELSDKVDDVSLKLLEFFDDQQAEMRRIKDQIKELKQREAMKLQNI